MTKSDWNEFEKEILDLGKCFVALGLDGYDSTSPKKITEDLEQIEKVLTIALQKLIPLQLQHRENQDILSQPFNWPVIQELETSRFIQGLPDIPQYPSNVIKELIELRDIAKHAVENTKPGRGNSKDRCPNAARKAKLGKNFVFRYRARFGHMPPISKTGKVMSLFERMLITAGEDNAGADNILRRAIEADSARSWLPSASIKNKRLK